MFIKYAIFVRSATKFNSNTFMGKLPIYSNRPLNITHSSVAETKISSAKIHWNIFDEWDKFNVWRRNGLNRLFQFGRAFFPNKPSFIYLIIEDFMGFQRFSVVLIRNNHIYSSTLWIHQRQTVTFKFSSQ